MTNMWMVRCGPNSIFFDDFIKEGIVAIGWMLGDLTNINKDELLELLNKTFPNTIKRGNGQAAGIIWNFVHNFEIGDYVVTYNPMKREYMVGTIVSDYKYISDIDNTELINQRDVEWFKGVVPRDELYLKTRKKLNSMLTVISLNEVMDNILKVLEKHMDNDYELIVNKIRKFLEDNNLGNFEQEIAIEESKNFLNSYSPDKLQDMGGKEVLYNLFPHDADKNTMSYYLEYISFFGGIRGGYPAVYGLYKSSKTDRWVMGSGKNRKEINENEAIEVAKKIVDALSKGVTLIQNSELNTVNDYNNLENELNNIFNDCPVNANYSWIHKYFSLICPDVIPVIHQDKMKKDMIRKFHMEPLKGYYANDAQLYMLSRDAGITLFSLFHEDVVSLFYRWDDHMWVGFDEKNLIDLHSNNTKVMHQVKPETVEPVENKTKSFNLNPNNLQTTLKVDEKTFYQLASVLNSSKHLILEGVPGTGKTHLAKDICEQIINQDMCNGYIITTATSDWTTFDVIGGLMPDMNGNLNFEEGIFLKAIRENKVLIIDEINRADIDKAFGQLFTVLSGSSVELNYKIDSKNISIKHTNKYESYFDDSEKTYYIGENFRIIATMNNYDKDSLYDMSYAFMRRFGFVEINIPDDSEYEDLIIQWNHSFNDEKLSQEYIANIKLLLGLNNYRKLGPAIFEDIMKYLCIRKDYGKNENIIEEVIISYIIPQFEGLQRAKLKEVKDFLVNNQLLSEKIANEKFEEYGLMF